MLINGDEAGDPGSAPGRGRSFYLSDDAKTDLSPTQSPVQLVLG